MSSSSESVELSVQMAAKMQEKSSFSQRCSLLSQYLKVKGSFGDLSLGMTCNTEGNVPETMNLFPTNENQFDVSTRNVRSVDLFPQQAGFSTSDPDGQKRVELSINKAATSDSPPAQMTIFYGGQVIVFDDFPADKAKDVMVLAGKGTSQSLSATTGFPIKNPPPVFSPNLAIPPMECSSSVPCTSNAVASFGKNLFQDRIQPPPKPISTDLPIARRASLHRFLEKRKDRIISRAPYTLNGSGAAAPSRSGESKSWLGLAAQFPVAP
ncbi:protein TIFY 10B [Euphorbia lathyris]